MNNNIMLHFTNKWTNRGDTYIKGSAFVDERLLSESELAEYFNKSVVEERVQVVNGFWGLVKTQENSIIMVADRIRSYPLFYGIKNSIAFISDDAYWVKEKVGEVEFEEISKKEFLLTGFVTGSDTLYKNVKQIQAGEIVSIDYDEEMVIKVNIVKHYSFVHGNYYKNLSREKLLEEHEDSLIESFNRLIKYAGGRTLVLPLSGGYDSRLVATILKKLEYKNVITFSYGKKDNPECLISKEIAKQLGFSWIFIAYDNEKSFQWYNSIERKNFSVFGDNVSTILPDREWPAVKELKDQNLIPKDSIFVPGHSGDFTSGGHIPRSLCKDSITKEQYVEEILKKHYVMWNWDALRPTWIKDFSNKILKTTEVGLFDISKDAANAYEKWNWQENQVKRMVNSVKIYDYFGYNYWLPFWDNEYLDFWCKVPLEYRINKNLYDEYVVNLYAKTANLSIKEARKREPPIEDNNVLVKGFNKVYRKVFSKALSRTSFNISKEELRDIDWEQASGRMTFEVYTTLLPYIVGRSSCSTLERLGYIDYTNKIVSDSTLEMLKMLKK